MMNKGVCSFILENGSSLGADAGFDVNDAFEALRTEMARLHADKHPWYTAKCEVTPDGKFTFNFDYDHLPAFDIIPSPGKWLDEFKHYPRPELQREIQDWIDGKVDAGEIVKRLLKLQASL